MLRSVSMTPLGSDVDPLVNCTIARRAGSGGGITRSSPRPISSEKRARGGSPGAASRNAARSPSINTSVASALATRARVWATNSSKLPRRMGSGRTTTVAPASQVAWIAVTSPRDVGPKRAT